VKHFGIKHKASNYEDAEKDDESSDDIEILDKAIHADKQALASDCCSDEIDTPSHTHQAKRNQPGPIPRGQSGPNPQSCPNTPLAAQSIATS